MGDRAACAESHDDRETVADMIVGFKGLRESFSCRVHKQRPHEVIVSYIDGPMKHLNNEWHFRPAEAAAAASIFSSTSRSAAACSKTLAGQMFDKALRKMIAAFEARADALYGAKV